MTEHVSRLALDRLAAGEPVVGAERHVAECGACRDRLAGVEAARARFAIEVDVAARVDAILRAAGRPRRRRAWLAAGGALAAAAAAAIVVVVARGADEPPLDGRPKGGAALEVVRRTPAGAIDDLQWGDVVHPGDMIRFRITARGHAAVLGIDAARVVTVYAPVERVAGTTVLDGSIILDDTLGPERIVLAVCDEPRPIDELVGEARAALDRAGGDPLRLGPATRCAEDAIVIHKEAR